MIIPTKMIKIPTRLVIFPTKTVRIPTNTIYHPDWSSGQRLKREQHMFLCLYRGYMLNDTLDPIVWKLFCETNHTMLGRKLGGG